MQKSIANELKDLKNRIANQPLLLRNKTVRRMFRLDIVPTNDLEEHLQFLNAAGAIFYIRTGKRYLVRSFYRWRTMFLRAEEARALRKRQVPHLQLAKVNELEESSFRNTQRYQSARAGSHAASTARTEKPDYDPLIYHYAGLESSRTPRVQSIRRPHSSRGRKPCQNIRPPPPPPLKSTHLGEISSHIHQHSQSRMTPKKLREFRSRAQTPTAHSRPILSSYTPHHAYRPKQSSFDKDLILPPPLESEPKRTTKDSLLYDPNRDAYLASEVKAIHKNMRSKLVRDIYRKYLASIDLAEKKCVRILPLFEKAMLSLRSNNSAFFNSMLQTCQSLRLLQHFKSESETFLLERQIDLEDSQMVNLVYNQDVRDLQTHDHNFTAANMRAWVAASLYRIRQNKPRNDHEILGNIFRLMTVKYRIGLQPQKEELNALYKDKIEQRTCEYLAQFLQGVQDLSIILPERDERDLREGLRSPRNPFNARSERKFPTKTGYYL